jgi:DNA-binding SARP family transcriptional activator
MKTLQIFLLGKFETHYQGQSLVGFEARKVQELLCYLLLHRDRPHAREALAGLLWDDAAMHSRTYLRKALWQLQAALSAAEKSFLLVKPEWIRLDSKAELWLDVAVLEEAYALVRGVPGQNLDDRSAKAVEAAVQLYRGNLLDNWYQDWCLSERERLQQIYLTMLDKLVGYCEAHHQYEAALSYGERILRHDQARERTHQQLMRLHYLLGDRTGALRQYEHCLAVLRKEFGAGPSESTLRLYRHIQEARPMPSSAGVVLETTALSGQEVLDWLEQLQVGLNDLQGQVQQAMKAVKLALENRPQASLEAGEATLEPQEATDAGDI